MSDNKTPDKLRDMLVKPASFKHWKRELVRFNDLDQNQHASNITFLIFAQSGRVEVLAQAGAPDGSDGETWMTVNVSMDFVGQLFYPSEVKIGSAVTHIGNTSVTIKQGIFEGDRCVAIASNTMVRVDQRNGEATPISDTIRKALLSTAPLLEIV